MTAAAQSAGRGRQGRSWLAPAGSALLASIVLREPPELLPLAAAVAVAETVDAIAPDRPRAAIKWPNDVLVDGRKVAGILVEARLQDRWAVLGIGLNVAVDLAALPAQLHGRAGTLGLAPAAIEPALARVLGALDDALGLAPAALLDAYRARDALRGREVAWAHGRGRAAGIDGAGRLVVDVAGGGRAALDAGEVHLEGAP